MILFFKKNFLLKFSCCKNEYCSELIEIILLYNSKSLSVSIKLINFLILLSKFLIFIKGKYLFKKLVGIIFKIIFNLFLIFKEDYLKKI